MSVLTIVVLAALVVWWYKPLRVFLVQRTNRTVKVLLVAFPLLYAARLGWRFYTGEQDDLDVVTLTVVALLLAWVFLVWLTSFLERRRPTRVQAPDLATLAKLPGVPRIPGAAQQVMQSPEARQAVRAAATAAANADWGNVAEGVGRSSGRLFARLKKGMAEDNAARAVRAPAAPPPAPAPPPAAPPPPGSAAAAADAPPARPLA